MRHQRGFSFVELLFALMVLTVVILTTLSMFAERSKRLQQAAETILVYQVLANEGEIVRRVDFGELDALTDKFSTDTTILDPLKPYTTEVDVVPGRSAGVKAVTLSVKWNGGQRVAQLTLMRAYTGGTNLW
ncbi:MAG: prepilin-type N-terminal cleavage/methylation domain-containing protein [Thermoanaerobaculia bacterium]|nr:prepilin-type N-terminal cleavage/methylation domain-containing protein [Thermoanaerobaculia bacterium]